MSSTSCSSRLRALVFVALALLVAAPATAAPEALGRAQFSRGLELYRAGRYREAIGAFEAGYAVLPNPTFLLNIAQAWRQLGDLAKTRDYYAQFVARVSPRNPARAQALEALARIDAQLEHDRAAEKKGEPAATAVVPAPAPAPAQTLAPAPAPAPRRSSGVWAGVALVAFGAATLGTGVGLLVDALSLDDRYQHPAPGTVYDGRLVERRDLERDLAIGAFALGGACASVGAIVSGVLLPRRARAIGLRLQPRVGLRSAALTVEGRL